MSLSSPTSSRPPLSRSTTLSPKLTTTPTIHRGASYEQSKQAAAVLSKFSSLHSPQPRQADNASPAAQDAGKTDYFSYPTRTSKDTSESSSISSVKKKPATDPKASTYFSFPDFDDHYQRQSRSDDNCVSESCRA